MAQSTPEKEGVRPSARRARPDIVWMVLVWGRVALGLVLSGVGGVAFGHAWTREYAPLWWVGAITLLTGILLVLSGLYVRSHPPGVKPDIVVREAPPEEEPLVPLLGSLLVYKYQWITQKQLSEALALQRKGRREKRLLGELLLTMGAITRAQLDEALEYQRSVLREKHAVRVR